MPRVEVVPRRRPPGVAAPRQLDQPRLQRREPRRRPGRRWLPSRAGVDLVNLGFGGSALLDPFTARTMRDTPADLISVKLGINLVNTDLMRLRAFAPAVHGFLDTIREGHPTTPLLVVSPLLCPLHEETPGPLMPDFSRLSDGRAGLSGDGRRRRPHPPDAPDHPRRSSRASSRASRDRSPPALPRRPRAVRRGRLRRAAAARRAAPRHRHASAHRRPLRRPRLRRRWTAGHAPSLCP